MARELYKISPFVSKPLKGPASISDLNHVVTEINKLGAEVGKLIGTVQGRDGALPKFANDLDLDGNRIRNVRSIQFGSRTHAFAAEEFSGNFEIDEPNPTPADATALAGDLIDNVIPDIRAALNEIGALLVKIQAVLRV